MTPETVEVRPPAAFAVSRVPACSLRRWRARLPLFEGRWLSQIVPRLWVAACAASISVPSPPPGRTTLAAIRAGLLGPQRAPGAPQDSDSSRTGFPLLVRLRAHHTGAVAALLLPDRWACAGHPGGSCLRTRGELPPQRSALISGALAPLRPFAPALRPLPPWVAAIGLYIWPKKNNDLVSYNRVPLYE